MVNRSPYPSGEVEHRPEPETGRVSNSSSTSTDSKRLDLDMSFDKNRDQSVLSTYMILTGPKSKCRGFKSDFLHKFHFSFAFATMLVCLASSIHVTAESLKNNPATEKYAKREEITLESSSSTPENRSEVSHVKPIQSRSAPYFDGGYLDQDVPLPKFDTSIPQNVTAGLGYEAYLKCRVNRVGDKMVSWIRTRDFHVLTVGLYRYTTDKRFSAIHSEDSNEWTLKISYTNLTDIGTYECQVNSDPKLSYFVSLNVVVPKTKITSAPDLYVRSGSSIRLECIISQSPDPPVFVFWYHDERMINYDVKRSRIKTVHKINKNTARSVLTIDDAGPLDSGNYTCYPSNSKKAHITVHVLNGETPAAMQDHENNKTSKSIRICPLSSFVFISSICHFMLVLFPR